MIKLISSGILLISSSFLVMNSQANKSYFKTLFQNAPDTDIAEPDRLMGDVLDDVIEQLRKKYDVFPIGLGMGGKFRKVSLSFEINKILSRDEARVFLLDAENLLLEAINTNDQLKQYLHSYPFTNDNAGIVLYICKKNQEKFYFPDICVARCGTNGIMFRTNDPESEFGYKTLEKETIEESSAKVEKYQAQKLTASNSSP